MFINKILCALSHNNLFKENCNKKKVNYNQYLIMYNYLLMEYCNIN